MFESKFQSFSETADVAQGPVRLAKLREKLNDLELDGFIIPRADRHQNEYTPACEERLAWLTGFTGSAGAAVALKGQAAIFVDGRYTLQVAEQVDAKTFQAHDLIADPPADWLRRNVKAGEKIGFDPWLHTSAQAAALRKAVTRAGAELIAVSENPIDAIWEDRPPEPMTAIFAYPARLAGASAAAKILRLQRAMAGDGLLASDPHAVAWVFNIRGHDVAHTPLPLCWAMIRKSERPILYVAAAKLSAEIAAGLVKTAELKEPDQLCEDLREMGAQGHRLTFDATTAPEKLVALFKDAGGEAEIGADPASLMKAVKNSAELRGARAAHLRDGAALTEFLAFFEANARDLDEIEAAKALETFRRATKKLTEISFPTISAFGAHAASPHYRVTEKTNISIGRGLYLTDSGAQYLDGTTDVTRVIAVGVPTKEMRDRFTRVLKGHIAIAACVFPTGVSGAQLDAFARKFLWDKGLDFDHGTGHGVGAYLSVHEGPQRISKLGTTPLVPGMILSNEPGYYKPGAYGIRIENLLVVEKRAIPGAERQMLGFEVLTLAPIDLNLVEPKLMDKHEIAWLNLYHKRVRAALLDKVAPQTRAWLKRATRSVQNI